MNFEDMCRKEDKREIGTNVVDQTFCERKIYINLKGEKKKKINTLNRAHT